MTETPRRTCSRDGCDRDHFAKDLCHSHYQAKHISERMKSDPEFRAKRQKMARARYARKRADRLRKKIEELQHELETETGQGDQSAEN